MPLPAGAQAAVGANVLGPPVERPPDATPPLPVEGGEAGAGKLFDKGDVGVVPGAGAGGGSGGPGRAGLGTGGPGRVAGHASPVCHQAQGWEATVGSPVRWVGIRSNPATQSPQDDRVLRVRRC